jgi:putative ABC transport system ATP-binding protein
MASRPRDDSRADPAAAAPHVVLLEGVCRTYPGFPPVEALKPCTLRLAPGEHLAVMGPSGSGKSTLLNLIGLLDVPDGGRYLLDGSDTSRLPERGRTALRGRYIGFVFQLFHLLAYRSTVENVELGMLYGGVPRRQRRARAVAALERVDLAHRMHALPPTLSGGERQRAAIARAIAARPRVLLCDEPTGNLDSETSASILELLGELHRDGLTLVIVTHDPEVAARAARLVTIRDGVVGGHGPARSG